MAEKKLEPTETSTVSPFGVEIDHHRNDDVMLQAIPGARLRSSIDSNKGAVNQRGETVIPLDQSIGMSGLSKIPGQQIHVNPKSKAYAIIDPLNDDSNALEKLNRFLRSKGILARDASVKAVPKNEGTLDQHRMKTLVRELRWLVQSGDARVVGGRLPDQDDIDSLPGEYLLNPGSRVQNTQPMFEKDYESYLSRLQSSGG